MKLKIKTLNQKSLVVDIDESKTVYDLKKELAMYPDVDVKPELQKLIYAGKILSNDAELSTQNFDTRKFLVVMVLKQPASSEESPTTSKASASEAPAEAVPAKRAKSEETSPAPAPKEEASGTAEPAASPATPVTPATPSAPSDREELVQNIVGMGYPEADVRRALAASFFNPERAIEYLIEGIPATPSTPEGGYYTDTDADLTPFEVFRTDPLFRELRDSIQQHPEMLNDAIQRVGEANPSILQMINENQEEFLSMLLDNSDDEGDGDGDEDDGEEDEE